MTGTEVSSTELRKFGFILGTGFLIISLGPLLKSSTPWWWMMSASGIIAGAALLLPRMLAPIYRFWMALGEVLGWINTRIILGLIFFLMFTPIAAVLRLLGKDPLARRLSANAETYWSARDGGTQQATMKDQF